MRNIQKIQQTLRSIVFAAIIIISGSMYGQSSGFTFFQADQKGNKISNLVNTTASLKNNSGTIFTISGITSANQIYSLAATFSFSEKPSGRTISQISSFIQLYKLEAVKYRSFSIPVGNNSATLIPIQVKPKHGTKGYLPGAYDISFPSGNLQTGEYAFIDKSSMNSNGSALISFPFTIK